MTCQVQGINNNNRHNHAPNIVKQPHCISHNNNSNNNNIINETKYDQERIREEFKK
jgi:hypothetical protein